MTEFLEPEPSLPIADRSTLERWATCPRQASYVDGEYVRTDTDETASGTEAHRVLSEVIQLYLEEPEIPAGNLRAEVMRLAAQTRPDVQPDVLVALRRSAWSFASYISGEGGIHPRNILRHDGGRGARAGQIAKEFGGAILTCEVDLLHSGRSRDVLHLVDWKTGHKAWTAQGVADSFQFQFYSWLVMENYPDVEAVEVQIWNTRTDTRSGRVMFERRNTPQVEERINTAVGLWLRWRGRVPASVPAWPTIAKCAQCPAAALCEVASQDIRELRADPGAYLDSTVALQNRLDARLRLLDGYVDATGADVVSAAGNAYGTCKPRSSRKAPRALYSVTTDTEEA